MVHPRTIHRNAPKQYSTNLFKNYDATAVCKPERHAKLPRYDSANCTCGERFRIPFCHTCFAPPTELHRHTMVYVYIRQGLQSAMSCGNSARQQSSVRSEVLTWQFPRHWCSGRCMMPWHCSPVWQRPDVNIPTSGLCRRARLAGSIAGGPVSIYGGLVLGCGLPCRCNCASRCPSAGLVSFLCMLLVRCCCNRHGRNE